MELECPASIEELASSKFGGCAGLLVLVVSAGPENSCEEPQLGNTGGSGRTDAGAVEDVLLGIVVFGNIELADADWSAIIDGGV